MLPFTMAFTPMKLIAVAIAAAVIFGGGVKTGIEYANYRNNKKQTEAKDKQDKKVSGVVINSIKGAEEAKASGAEHSSKVDAIVDNYDKAQAAKPARPSPQPCVPTENYLDAATLAALNAIVEETNKAVAPAASQPKKGDTK